jgi:hypothetical protein
LGISYSQKIQNMKYKISSLIICAALAIGALSAFAIQGQTATCDASNDRKCVITNVGEGTGKLIVETTP